MRPLGAMAAAPLILIIPVLTCTGRSSPSRSRTWCLIAVMVVIFGAALLLPFPKGRTYPPAPDETGTGRP